MLCRHSSCCPVLLLFARICMSAIFILAGLMKIMDFQDTVTMMNSMNVPMSQYLLILAIVFELGGGLLLLLGLYTRFAALLLMIFVVLVTYFFHSFWDYQGAMQVSNMQHFMKNLFIFGSLLYVSACGAGKLSLDCVWRKSKECKKCKADD